MKRHDLFFLFVVLVLLSAGCDGAASPPEAASSDAAARLAEAAYMVDIDPVSYTHLDVYKRQTFFFRYMPTLIAFLISRATMDGMEQCHARSRRGG